MTSGIPQATIPAARCGTCSHFAPVGELGACRFCDCDRHTGTPYGTNDPQTPVGAENALEYFKEAMEVARKDLAVALDEEVEAELNRDAARDGWLLSDECPHVRRDECTVAERDAWVRNKVRDEEKAYRLAKAKRIAAEKYLTILGRQGSIQQSILKSVNDGMRMPQGFGR